MFYPKLMTQIGILVPDQYILAATTEVAKIGTFHQVDASYLSAEMEPGSTDEWRRKATAFATLERRLLAVIKTLGIEEGSPPEDIASTMELDAVQAMAERLEQQVHHVVEELAGEQKKLEQLQRYIQQLEPVVDIDVEIDVICHPRYVFSILGIIPVEHIERLQTSLKRIPNVLLPLYKDERQSVVILSGMMQHADILQRAARSAYLNPLNLPEDYQGTPREIIATLRADIIAMQAQITQQQEMMADLRKTRAEQLQTLLWQVRASNMLANIFARYGRLHYTYVISGWVPAADVEGLMQTMREISEDIQVYVTPSDRSQIEQDVPVALNNRGILHAFQQLVTIYGRPRYAEVDPTLYLALTFPLLFGTMFGDVGHGLVLMALGALLAGRKGKAQGGSELGIVVAVCGVVSAIFGFLYGSIFGLEDILPALWLRPMENIMEILFIAIGAGVVLLSVGFITGIVNAWMARDWGHLFFGHNGIAGFLLYGSLLGLATTAFMPNLPLPKPVFVISTVISGVGVMFSDLFSRLVEKRRPLIEGGLATYAVQIFFELFETVIGLLSNSLSYVRVGAFAVAHGGLSAVIFILAEMVDPARGVGYWLVVALGNLFIIGFEGMIVGIQTLRLEYYEFFSKFFTGGGTPYIPLTTARMKKGRGDKVKDCHS
ncbi:MAG: hypothetical protein JXA33_10075 [Anaerolineae bacterium]|nr:hypothetical protein [Anaerolineae bacterium]